MSTPFKGQAKPLIFMVMSRRAQTWTQYSHQDPLHHVILMLGDIWRLRLPTLLLKDQQMRECFFTFGIKRSLNQKKNPDWWWQCRFKTSNHKRRRCQESRHVKEKHKRPHWHETEPRSMGPLLVRGSSRHLTRVRVWTDAEEPDLRSSSFYPRSLLFIDPFLKLRHIITSFHRNKLLN